LLVVSFIDVGQGDAVLVQARGKSYLGDARRSEEGPDVVDLFWGRASVSLRTETTGRLWSS
jgi:competence protein ComEC